MDYICTFFKKGIDQGNFPFVPKHASIMLVFNESCRGSVDNLKNYCVSKYKHFMEQFIPNYQCGFRKGFKAQQSPWNVREMERSVDQRKRLKEVS